MTGLIRCAHYCNGDSDVMVATHHILLDLKSSQQDRLQALYHQLIKNPDGGYVTATNENLVSFC